MAHFGNGVEYALHCLLLLENAGSQPPSRNDLAEFQGVPKAFLAKLLTKLEKAGVVSTTTGISGGYRLARPAREISVLEVVDAIEGKKPLFDCQEIRGRCVLFENRPPAWSQSGVCGIHALMLAAEKKMRDELATTSLADLSKGAGRNAPPEYAEAARRWFADRVTSKDAPRIDAIKRRARRPAGEA